MVFPIPQVTRRDVLSQDAPPQPTTGVDATLCRITTTRFVARRLSKTECTQSQWLRLSGIASVENRQGGKAPLYSSLKSRLARIDSRVADE